MVFPSFLTVLVIALFYLTGYIDPSNIILIGIIYFFMISVVIIFLSTVENIKNRKGFLYVAFSIFVINAIYFVLLYLYAKPYRDSLEKDLNYLLAVILGWVFSVCWIWFLQPKKKYVLFEKFAMLNILMINFCIFILLMLMAPNYVDYSDRALASEGIALAKSAKVLSEEFYKQQKRFPNDNQEVKLLASRKIVGFSVKSIDILPKGKIQITFNDKLADNAMLFLEASLNEQDEIVWQCREVYRLEMNMLPASCRGEIQEYERAKGGSLLQ